ncbi:hypothetical protein [Mycolicibacterium pyrenivorans]|uniref:hypothetical protein n=1 Tax=Mycolicibacterium pyrenivorans TaxID=187102 RepID=UPI0021F29DCB|nr:hypothetical protein [Mycolicibacterium pyrenivorans]MCV7150682.1 hypothetical protein [Mycolicibacterium pyrenivorans]
MTATETLDRPLSAVPTPVFETGDALTSVSVQEKTRVCKDCRARKPEPEFPTDKHGRADTRMCLQCVDENTPTLMTESEISKWLGVTIAEVRTWPTAGDYTPHGKATLPLYSRPTVSSDYLPAGWRSVFDWTTA